MLAQSAKFRLFKLLIIIPLLCITNPEKLIAAESRDASVADSKIECSAELLLNKIQEHRSKVKNPSMSRKIKSGRIRQREKKRLRTT